MSSSYITASGGGGVPSRTASTIVADTTSGYHILKIDGYSRTLGTPPGECLVSRPFTVGGHSWHVKYYPNSVYYGGGEHISLYLVLDGNVGKAVKAQFLFNLVVSPSSMAETTQPLSSAWLRAPVCLFASQGVWGLAEFVRRQDLERSEILQDDSFTVRCDVAVINELRAEDSPPGIVNLPTFMSVPPSNLHKQLDELLQSGKGADVVFQVGYETFAAHRCVLAARSPVFDAELFGTMKEGDTSSGVVRIDDMEAQVFKGFLYFMYTDSLPETRREDEDVMFQHLLVAADRYQMLRLKLMCEEKLCKYIDVPTVANILTLAERHYCIGLRLACLSFLGSSENLRAVMASDDFDYLYNSCPSIMKQLIATLGTQQQDVHRFSNNSVVPLIPS